MKVLITTAGSRGDVQPYIALGKGLVAAGHTVTLCTHARFEGVVTAHGLGYAPLSDDLLGLIDSAEGRGAMEDMGGFFSAIKTVVRLGKRSGPIQRALVADGWRAAQSVRPDLIVYNVKMFGAPHYAEKLGIPSVMAVLFPQFVPTRAFPTVGFPQWKIGGAYNRLTYHVVLKIAGAMSGTYVRAWRAAHGLPRLRRVHPLQAGDGAPIPVLHGFSPHLVSRPLDWPERAVVTGTWFLDRDPAWTPPPDLEAFLAAGAPPVYVGFGSMSGRDPARLTRLVIEAVQRAGLRAVLATGWGGLRAEDVPPSIFVLDRVPHDWLFPRVAAVVHHGGAGTTAAGLRAGKPTVICSFFGDQPFWGWRVHDLGVGPAPIPQRKLTADKLAKALRIATSDAGMRDRAEALGEKLRREDGVANAVAVLEALGERSRARAG